MVKNLPVNAGDTGLSGGQTRGVTGTRGIMKIPLEKETHGQRSLAGYSPWGAKELDKIQQPDDNFFSLTLAAFSPITLAFLPVYNFPSESYLSLSKMQFFLLRMYFRSPTNSDFNHQYICVTVQKSDTESSFLRFAVILVSTNLGKVVYCLGKELRRSRSVHTV